MRAEYTGVMNTVLVDYFRTQETIEVALLFGSCATGVPTASSDFDVAVLCAQTLDSPFKLRLIEQLALITGRPIDLIDLRNVGQPLLGQILKGAQRLKGTDSQIAMLYSRNVFEAADFLPYVVRVMKERQESWIR
jgi:uncharacterized protein